ncbi:hypothetical protein FRB94_006223 [Tulasnella sp. JGI-2019a]|nr:hypothetical protein FRB94_006223 [Tulasnella sp. JGI-2019a]
MLSIELSPELWLAVFDQLDHEPHKKIDLRNVSKTSQLFHALTQPLLFAKILLLTHYSPDTQTAALIRDLAARAEARQWVKSVIIETQRSDGHTEEAIVDIFMELQNLRTIRINHTSITDKIVQHLLRLSHPFSFHCWNIACAPEIVNLVSDIQNLRIVELVVNRLRGPNIIPLITRLALGPHLSVLHLSRSVSPAIYQIPRQNPDHRFNGLQCLEIYQPEDQTEMEGFLGFLASCPQLSYLKIIPYRTSITDENFALPSASIPHLSSFNGPYELARILVSGRPLLSLTLVCSRYTNVDKELFSNLREGSAPLRELYMGEITWHDDILLQVAEHFPALQNIHFWVAEINCFDWIRERLASDIQRLPQLQQFGISSFEEWTDDNTSALSLLKATNHRLAPVGFWLKTEWERGMRQWVLRRRSQIWRQRPGIWDCGRLVTYTYHRPPRSYLDPYS